MHTHRTRYKKVQPKLGDKLPQTLTNSPTVLFTYHMQICCEIKSPVGGAESENKVLDPGFMYTSAICHCKNNSMGIHFFRICKLLKDNFIS